MQERLQGVFTPILVPLDERGNLHEAELRRFVNWLIERGVHGLYPNGSTGEFTRFTADERRLITKIVCEEARGRVPVLAGAAEANVKETVAACETYRGYGVTAVAIVSPFYYRLSPPSVLAYFREIADNSPIEVTVYNIPLFATPIDVPTMRQLAEHPRIVGIKDSSGDLPFMMRLLAAIRPQRPDFSFLTGWDAVFVPMMLIGCDGGTNATSNALPEVMRRMYELSRAGQFDEALKIQYRLLELFDAMLNPFEFPDGFRAAAESRGFRFGRGRVPMTEMQRQERETLSNVVECLVSDFGYTSPPAAGCKPQAGAGEDDKVGRIVLEVMQVLEQRGVLPGGSRGRG